MSAWLTFAALAAVAAPSVQVDASPAQPRVDEIRIEVAGRSLRALCTGTSPEVILLHDAGESADMWRRVLERLGPDVVACAYDRSGASGGEGEERSERGWFELLEELALIHEALGARPGYVLVGQGEAGMYARLMAASRRHVAGGLVLLEPTHEDLPRLVRPALPEDDWGAWMELRSRPNADGVRPSALAARARRSRLADMPVTVVTATRRPAEPDWDERFLDEAARRAHEDLVRGRPFGRHVPAPGSGPDLSRDAPAVVADEILRVLRIVEGR